VATATHGLTRVLRRLIYVSGSTLPSPEANAVHVAHMCDAFAGLGIQTELLALRGGGGSVAAHYGLHHPFRIRSQSALAHKAWLLGRRLRPAPKAVEPVYFGRRLKSLAQLARWGYPVGLEIHHPPRNPSQVRALADLVAAPRFLGLVVISEALRREILSRMPHVDPARVLLAHDGVREDRIREPAVQGDGAVRAVYCGSFHPGKGVETILEASRFVPDVCFDLIGGQARQIEALRATAPPNVRFLGHLPHEETQRLLPTYHLALAPYGSVVRGAHTPAHESLSNWMSPLKIFEYVAAGVPILTSDLPVLREILEPDRTASMTPPGDAVALADAIRALGADAGRRDRMARDAQSQLREYTWENRARAIADFLEAGVAATSGPRA
jgi:glycosyltransferase involved in cell wall biosynthesis